MSVVSITFSRKADKRVPAEAEEWVPAGTIREVKLEFSGSHLQMNRLRGLTRELFRSKLPEGRYAETEWYTSPRRCLK